MKFLIVEYDSGVPIEQLESYGMKATDIIKSVDSANRRIASNLHIKRNVLTISDGNLIAQGIAGVIKLSNNIELEIMPKFFSEKTETEWRPTLYLLSALSQNGSILVDEKILSNSSHIDFLYELSGRILAAEYEKNKRKPIRKYHKENFCDFSIEGEIDFDNYLEKKSNGIGQKIINFDKKNKYNATISAAMKQVKPYISDNKTRNILKSAIINFEMQPYTKGPREKIPPRNKEWEKAYNLAYDIMQGLGSSFDDGNFYAPGFIANTWQMWEWLITIAIQIGEKEKQVIKQNRIKWGEKNYSDKITPVNVFPDISVFNNNNFPEYLVDAKYKLIENDKTGEIERSDLYEAYAFCNSLNCNHIFLAYPIDFEGTLATGMVKEKSIYNIRNTKVHVIMVVLGTIKEKGGLYNFSTNLVEGIHEILNKY